MSKRCGLHSLLVPTRGGEHNVPFPSEHRQPTSRDRAPGFATTQIVPAEDRPTSVVAREATVEDQSYRRRVVELTHEFVEVDRAPAEILHVNRRNRKIEGLSRVLAHFDDPVPCEEDDGGSRRPALT